MTESGDGKPPRPPKKDIAEFHRKPTPWPPFDMPAFARDSDLTLRESEQREAAQAISTAPPPPFHPASVPPPGALRPSRAPMALSESTQSRLEECANRIQMLRGQLSKGDMSREEAANVMRVELLALESEARASLATSLVVVVAALRAAVEELGGIAHDIHGVPLDIVVLDEDPSMRDRIALAIESMGHAVRSASSVAELGRLAQAHVPNAIAVAAEMHGPSPQPHFCAMLRESARSERTRVLVYTATPGTSLADVARDTGATHCLSASVPLEGIVEQLGRLLVGVTP